MTGKDTDLIEIDVNDKRARRVRNDSRPAAVPPAPPARQQDSLGEQLVRYGTHLAASDLAENTKRAFASDIQILTEYFPEHLSVGSLTLGKLEAYFDWMQKERKAPCNNKTLSRRITSTRSFFGWLIQEGHLQEDPTRGLKRVAADPHVPTILNTGDIKRLNQKASDIFWKGQTPDARPLLLLQLLLQTGMKKKEVTSLRFSDFRFGSRALVHVRSGDGQPAYRDRHLPLSRNFGSILDAYRSQYAADKDDDTPVFDCTARNLEYQLEDLGRQAGPVSCKVGFEVLRWTAAVSDLRIGIDPEALRHKLGLSPVAWRNTRVRLHTLI
ncbi:MAG: phage integrase N-terminal SAM-like domain-containing protein [Caldilineaceae bacterium]|nr:phage integrase N-terminal SAM-like domain-containing protein [Caldilineaceae bacterium]